MADLIFVGQYIASKVGATGLTVTVDVDRYTISDGARSSLVTAGSATEGRRGLYHYRLASADLSLYQYVATFITSDATVDQQQIAALGLVVPDALVSSRLAPAGTLATVTNLTNAATAGDLTATMKASVTTAATAATPTVAAVTGNVGGGVLGDVQGNLMGNVGGNVVGRVGSVDGDVGGGVLGGVTGGVDYVVTVVNDVNAVTLANGAIKAIAFDGSTAYPVTSADTGATRISRTGADSDTLETLSDQIDAVSAGSGVTAQQVWEYVTRTLTQSSTSITDSTAAGSIARRRGDSWSMSLTIGAITGYTSLWFTAKWDRMDTDAQSILQIKKNASGLLDGLLYVNGAAATDATKASITVSNAATGAIIVAVDETITDDLPPTGAYYDVQVLNAGTVTTPESGTLTISADVTRAVA